MVAERVPETRPALSPLCKNGHKRTFRTTYRDPSGYRRCVLCVQIARQRYEAAHPRRWLDRPRQGRRRGGATCQQGHPFTPDNVRVWKDGQRRCLTCQRAYDRAYRRRRAEARKQTATVCATTQAPVVALRPAERPLGAFDAVVAAQVAQAREIRARGEVRFSDAVNAGLAAARERRRAALGATADKATPEQIRQATADAFGLDVADLTGPSREHDVSRPRQAAYYLIRQECPDATFEAIGALFGGRDHTTTSYGYQKIERLVAAGDEDTLRLLDVIREALGEVTA